MSDIVLINISGEDRPGITASLMGILARYATRVLDIGQAMIQDTLALAILIEIPDGTDSSAVLKDVLFQAHQDGLRVRFSPVSREDYERRVRGEELPRWVVTLLGPRVTAEQLARIARVVTDNALNIEDIVRLSGRGPLHADDPDNRACLELTLRGTPRDSDAMKTSFLEISEALAVDISFQEDNFFRRNRRLVVFDMDSTLIQQEVIDELAREAGAGEAVARITEAAMRGEIDFRESLVKRVAALAGLEESVLQRVADRLTLTEGAERLLRTLRTLGYRTAVVSGGFSYFGRILQQRLRLDYTFANELEIEDGHLTGRVSGRIVDGDRKAELLREIAEREGIALDQVIAVGDGANDLPMLSIAGLGIAFHAKPLVKEQARHSIATVGLDGILYLIGMRDRDLEALGSRGSN